LLVHCRAVDGEVPRLYSGMTGYARIDCGRERIALVVWDRVMRTLRTEFWW
jgi:hypothetical protein